MLTLTKEASDKYVELNNLFRSDIAKGITNSKYAMILAVIHDKYRAIQNYPNVGSIVSKYSFEGREYDLKSVPLTEGWKMLYIDLGDYSIKVVDFVNNESK